MINPLLRPQEVEKELQGDALVNQIQIRMMQQDIKSPAFNAYAKDVMETRGYPNKTMQEYSIEFPSTIGALLPLAPMKADNQLNVTPPSVPLSKQTPLEGVSQDIFGNPNIIRDSDGNPLPSLGPIQDNNAFPIGFGSGDSRDITSILPPRNNSINDARDKTIPQISDTAELQKATRTLLPIVSGPEEFAIASNQQIPDAGLFNRVGQQLIGYDDQFSGINDRLNKIEEGIASLIQNKGQGLNMNTGGLGYFFNPFGGFYG